MTARDATGRELKVGQRVTYAVVGQANSLRIGTVDKMSPKTVTLKEVNEWGGVIRRSHKAVCIVDLPPRLCDCNACYQCRLANGTAGDHE